MEKAWKKCPIMFFKQKSWVWPAIHQKRSLVRNFLSCLSRTLADSLNTLHDFENILFTNTNCSLCLVAQLSEFCRPWEVKALCLGRSEGRAGIGILSRPSLVESEIWRLLSFLRLFLNDWRTFILILISVWYLSSTIHTHTLDKLHFKNSKTFNQC